MVSSEIFECLNWFYHDHFDLFQIHFKNYGVLWCPVWLVDQNNSEEGYYYKSIRGVNYSKVQLEQINKLSKIKRLWEFGLEGKSKALRVPRSRKTKWKKKPKILLKQYL